jgi:hypothetical protein
MVALLRGGSEEGRATAAEALGNLKAASDSNTAALAMRNLAAINKEAASLMVAAGAILLQGDCAGLRDARLDRVVTDHEVPQRRGGVRLALI